MRVFPGVASAALAILLAACASGPVAPPAAPQALHTQNEPWSLHGRIALKNGDKSLSGQLQWQHTPARDELTLASPLGQGVARLTSSADGVVLIVPDHPERRAPDAETLTRQTLGVALPLAGLRYWIEGRPDPARAHRQTLNDAGRIAQLKQDGWVVDYLQYRDAPDWQPRKLVLARDDMTIRLVIDTWQMQ
jgi:outer membrane lipoprotein LolB